MSIIFFIFAALAIFICLHGLIYQDSQELAFIIALFLFLTCICLAKQYNVAEGYKENIEESNAYFP